MLPSSSKNVAKEFGGDVESTKFFFPETMICSTSVLAFMADTSHETEISCGERESASPAVKAFSSSQKLSAGLPAVRFIDWLGGRRGSQERRGPVLLITTEETRRNWRLSAQLAPSNNHEPHWSLPTPGAYTAIVRGVEYEAGTAFVEVYDLR